MKRLPLVLACLLVAGVTARGEEPGPAQAAASSPCACVRAGVERCVPPGLRWTVGCFPRCGCPDDYCPNPYPRQCWPPYPPYYACVPAGDCGPAHSGRSTGRLTWWFLPTPWALREAIGCRP